MIQFWSAIAVAVLSIVVGPIVRGEAGGRLGRRMALHASIRSQLNETSDAARELDELLKVEGARLRERETRRMARKVSGASIAALVIVTLVGAGAVYGLLTWAQHLGQGGVWYWMLVALAVAIGAFAFALSAVGATTIYEYPEEKRS